MNTIFRIVWSVSRGQSVVTSELAKRRTKSRNGLVRNAALATGLVAGAGLLSSAQAYEAGGGDDCTGDNGRIAIGNGATACNDWAVALGNNADAAGESAISIGRGSYAEAINTGAGTTAGGLALGGLAESYGGVAVGFGAVAGADNAEGQLVATALGVGTQATANRAIGIGTTDAAPVLATGTASIAIGNDADASAQRSMAIGRAVNASATDAVAFGNNTAASGESAIAFGDVATASGISAIAMGAGATADADEAVAIGNAATATGGKAVSIGSENLASGNGAVAIGDPNTATGDGAIAQGMDNTATGDGTVALGNTNMVGGGGQAVGTPGTAAQGAVGIGYQNEVNGQGSIALGNTSSALQAGTIALGDTAAAEAQNSVALGTDTTSSSFSTVAIGAGASATNAQAIAIGGQSIDDGAQATGNAAIAVGQAASATGDTSVAMGWDATAENPYDIALGGDSNASGGNSLAVGVVSEASGASAGAVGFDSNASGDRASAYGVGAIASGDDSVALGGSTASGVGALAGGLDATASQDGSVALGEGATADIADSVALGSDANTDTAVGTANVTIAGETYDFAGDSPVGTVSVGTNGNERTITNVAAGRVSASSTDAINGSQLFATNEAIEDSRVRFYSVDGGTLDGNYDNDGATAGGAMAAGVNASAVQTNATAVGHDSLAAGNNSVSMGNAATAMGTNSVAIGNNASVGLASGSNSQFPDQGVAIGSGATVGGAVVGGVQVHSEGVAIGFDSSAVPTSQASPTAIGAHANADGEGAQIAIGDYATANGENSVAIGGYPFSTGTTASGDFALALGPSTQASGNNSVSLGRESDAGGDGAIAIGGNETSGANASQQDTIAIGAETVANTEGGIAIGQGARSSHANSTALGVDAVTAGPNATPSGTINGTSYTFAGGAPVGVVSVGSSGDERQITNVAAGRVSATSTDAINGSQLFATNEAIEDLSVGGGGTNYYSVNDDGTQGGNFANDGATGVNALAAGVDASATADSAIALGDGATAGDANSVALGTDSVTAAPVGTTDITLDGTNYTFAGGTPTGTVSLGDVGNERTITNVAAGRISASSTDAINGSQLFATNQVLEDTTATANLGWDLSAEGADTTNVAPGDEVDLTNADGNLSITKNDTDGALETVTFDLSDSVTVGNTTIDNTGIDMGGDAITNVGDPVDGGDALNLDYFDENRTRYYSVNDDGTQGGNFANDGADGVNAIAAGVDATATGDGSLAMGFGADARQAYGIALGSSAISQGASSIAMGDGASNDVFGNNQIAIGSNASSFGENDLAIGSGAAASGQRNIVLGTDASTDMGLLDGIAIGTDAYVSVNDGIAMGNGASADHAGSVALGLDSVTAAPVGTTDITLDGTNYSFAGGTPTGTVSLGDVGNERTLTNVAAGRISASSTDAINGSQLFATNQVLEDTAATANLGWDLSAQGADTTNVAPGDAVDLTNGDGNLSITKNDTDGAQETVTFDLSDDVTIGNSLTVNNGPTIDGDGIDMGGDTITNVGTPVDGGDAANKTYVDDTSDALVAQGMDFTGNDNSAGDVHRDLGQTLAITGEATAGGTYSGENLRTVTDPATGAIQLQMTDAPQFGDVTINEGDSGRISGVADGQAADDAVNVGQLEDVSDVAGAGWDLSAQGADTTNVAPGDAVDLTNADGNLSITKNDTDGAQETVTFDLSDDVMIGNSLTVNNGPTIDGDGIDMGGDTITNVGTPVDGGDAANKTYVDDTSDALVAQGMDFSGNDNSAGDVHRDLGQTLAITGEATAGGTYSGENLRTVTDPATGAIQLQMTDAPQFGDVTINEGDSGRISGVADGSDDNDAVNVSQLESVSDVANAGWGLQANGDTPTNVAPGETVQFVDGQNIEITRSGLDVMVATTDDLTTDSLTVNNGPTIDGDGIDMGGDTITNVGTPVDGGDAANKTYVDDTSDALVAQGMDFTGNDNSAGDVHRDLGQTLAITGEATAGGTYSGENLRTVTDPATGAIQLQMTDAPQFGDVTINEGDSGRISGVADGQAADDAVNVGQLEDVSDVAGAGWDLSAQGADTTNVAPGDAVDLTNADGNLSITKNDTDGAQEMVTFDLSDDVMIGNSLTVNNGPTIDGDGIDMGGDTITNVGAPVDSGDAVNLDYFNENSVHYYSVNDNGTQGGNYDNDGAIGVNALAAGVDALAGGNSAVAMGNGASADGLASVAIGRNTIAPRLAVAIGPDAGSGLDPASLNIVAIGSSAAQNGNAPYSVALGSASGLNMQGQDNVVIGRQSATNLDGIQNVAIGSFTFRESQGDNNTAVGYASGFTTIGGENTALGYGAGRNVTGDGNTALGQLAGRTVTGSANVALGREAGNNVSADSTVSIGDRANASATNAIAMGAGAQAANADGVALGSGAVTATPVSTPGVTLNGIDYDFAGISPQSTVSVGDVGSERTITNVAAGRISDSSTDAINGSQLFATNQAVEDAASTAEQGWDLSAQGADTTNVAPGDAVDLTNADGNLSITKNATEGALETVTFDLSDEVVIGDTTINDDGIDMGGDTITNLGDPVDGGDAVNLDYFNENSAHYYSVNDDGIPQDNYANDGASGVDSLAAGVAASTGSGAERALALGYNTSATGVDSVAIGQYASAESGGAIAIGRDATAGGGQATSIGYGNTAMGDGAVAIGDPSTAIGDGALALGKDNYAEGTGAVAVGNTNTSEGDGALAIGDTNTSSGNGAITMGVNNQATGDGAVAMGNDNMVTGEGAFAVGNNATSGALDTLALGTEASATSQHAMALGNSSDASALNAFAAGNTAVASGENSMALGQMSLATGLRASAIGLEAVASAEDAMSVGTQADASGLRSTTIGNNSVAAGQGSSALGSNADAQAFGSVAIGARSTAVHDQSIALGGASRTVRGPQDDYTAYGLAAPQTSKGELAIGQVAVFDESGNQLTEPGERQITGVAAGSADTDAVNVSQLKGIETHYYSVNDDGVIGGNYENDGASGINAVASGVGALASTEGSVALGSGSIANRALAPASGAIPAGDATVTYNTTDKELLGAVSVGDSDSYRQITNVADGIQEHDAVTVRQLQGAIGSVVETGTKYFHANSTQPDSAAVGEDSIAVGPTTVVNGDAGIGMGNGAIVGQMAPGGTAIGDGAEVMLADGMALGTASLSEAEQGIALGAGATVSHDQSVALGSNSVTAEPVATSGMTLNGIDYDFAGAAPQSTVSVGDVGDERTITNVAAGRISETSTDAVNGSQLYATSQAIEILNDEVAAGQVHYYSVNDGGTEGGNYDNSGATGVNAIAGGVDASATADGAVAMGAGATASDSDSVALGSGATTEAAVGTSDITIGGQTYAFAGISPIGTLSVGMPGAERTITNVAAGRISADSTDAINGSQLHATNQAVENVEGVVSDVEGDVNELGDRVTNVEGDVANIGDEVDQLGDQAVQYDTNPDGSVNHDTITLEGDGGTTITNVADGDVSDSSTDAVNGGQLWEVQEQITSINEGGSKYFQANSEAAAASAEGAESVAMGPESVAEGDHSVAAGDGAVAESDGGVALGAGSEATREGMNGAEEAFSNESVASTQGAVSVGSEGGERQITHVAGGTEATDAVNVRQLESVQAGSVNYDRNDDGSVDYGSVTMGQEGTPTQVHNVAAGEAPTDAANVGQLQELNQQFSERIGGLGNRIEEVHDQANAGVASAIAAASVPQAYLPGKSMMSAGAGTYNGEAAVSVGASRLSDNGRWAVKLNFTGDSQGNFGAGVGAGFHW